MKIESENRGGNRRASPLIFEDFTLTWKDDPAAKEKCWQICLDWFIKMEAFSGECICQNDNPMIYAPEAMAKIADLAFEFKQKWKE